ncbi:bifunctional serine/threonine-protein kinase/formylglycine-generating enzyme family protein [Nostoc sp. CMAA1605]|uniref:bifunctional serine/threonine-protein kinase/formylglycine-generating enzyme family protein n=1 Tax=Nostoc sp. CMAA1605 TaxID=2055159 RepID=UPI001F3DA769|nr:bifunctional serine/threonine-protein kinase/formylglycine-generating enzyme family protein [Nostoc sp. CMAA1605]MCF4966136.1 serine/threonine protein kinase [Nostoc sp. CMAA1605]
MNTLAGRYEIIKLLGGGGFAVTYLARDNFQPSKPLCVVKQLRPNQTQNRVIEFFEKEAAILERLGKHPYIPQLLAHFNQDDNLYIVQEFIEGQDLSREIFPGKRLSESYVTKLLQDALEILSFVHQQGVIHRDIKPQNLMRRQDVKIILIDFGAVKELGTLMINSQGEVNSSVVIGTPGYMSYEQYRGKPCFGSDIYALGVMAIQALTGVLPAELPEDPQTGEIIWQNKVQVSNHLAEVLTKMVRHHFSMRYLNATEALQALISVTAPLPPTVLSEVNKELYLQEVISRAQQGEGNFSVIALRILESRRVELGLTEEEAREIQTQALQPYREYERKLQEYEQALIDVVKQEYPFSQRTHKELQDYQQHLGLRSEDIAAIEARVFAPLQSKSQQPQKEAERLRQQQEASNAKSNPIIKTQPFEFETATITVTNSGFLGLGKKHEINRSQRRAEYFRENLGNGVALDMVAIPSGQFLMGSPENEPGRYDFESPQHNVTVKPFFMGKFPVTQAQWQAVAAFGKVNIDLNPNPSRFKGANRPVEKVSWYEAVEFCARLSQKTGRTYRLPSEAEWEYACRAGTTTPYYFGDMITKKLANYNNFYQQTNDVGKFPANPFGLYDMHGNIWEWCLDDWHENYQGAPIDGSPWFPDHNHLYQKQGRALLRGGSWNDNPISCRSASRDLNHGAVRDFIDDNIGFRVVCGVGRILQ